MVSADEFSSILWPHLFKSPSAPSSAVCLLWHPVSHIPHPTSPSLHLFLLSHATPVLCLSIPQSDFYQRQPVTSAWFPSSPKVNPKFTHSLCWLVPTQDHFLPSPIRNLAPGLGLLPVGSSQAFQGSAGLCQNRNSHLSPPSGTGSFSACSSLWETLSTGSCRNRDRKDSRVLPKASHIPQLVPVVEWL